MCLDKVFVVMFLWLFVFIGAHCHSNLSSSYLRQLIWPNIYIRQQCVEDNDLISLIALQGRIAWAEMKFMVQLGWARHVTSLVSCYLTVKRTHYLQELVLFSRSPICIPCNSLSMQSCYIRTFNTNFTTLHHLRNS